MNTAQPSPYKDSPKAHKGVVSPDLIDEEEKADVVMDFTKP
jgi:hypothetical protein